jgi:hypothetical protein
MALLTLSAGDTVGLSFGSFNIIGTRTGSETVILSNPISGNLSVTLDPSFNQGGDTIVLAGSAADYTIVRSGSSVIMTNGSITVTIPVGTVGANVVFANGAGTADDDVRVLKFVTGTGIVLDGGIASENQVVGTTVAAVAVNDAPVVANLLADRSVAEDTAVNFTLPANSFSDVDGDTLALTATLAGGAALPTWLTFNAATGTFSGTPPLNFNGAINVTVTARDPGGLTASDTFTLTVTPVNDAPVLANALADRSVAEDTAVNFTLPANSFSDVDNASLTISATLAGGAPLPAWLTFNAATGTFSGTPPLNFNGSLDVTVTASDGGTVTANDTFTLTVTPVNDTPVVAIPLADRSVAEDTAVNFTLPANSFSDVDNASLTLSATLAGGAPLPAWLTFNAATGTFSGTPPLNFNGSLDVTVTASDGSLTANDTFTLTVTPVNDTPVLAVALADQSFAEDTAVSFTVPANAFTDVDNASLTYSATGMPAWLSFDPATRSFSGIPPLNFNGFVDVTVTASDGSLSASDTLRLTITPVTDVTVSAASVTEGDPGGPARQVTFTLTLDNPSTAPVSVSYFTTAGTATANDDFVPTAGIVTFVPGQTVAFVSVPIIGDLVVEPAEAFTLTASVVGTPSTFGITSTATGTIIENDTVQGTLTAFQDTLAGTANTDIFIGQNRNLNAGDSISDAVGTDTDVLNFATDTSLSGTGDALFGGFTFNGLEIFSVTNDSGRVNDFDLSGATGLKVLESTNSSAAVVFRNVGAESTNLKVTNLTNDTSTVDVTVSYRDAAAAAPDNSIVVDIAESQVNRVRIGRSSDDDAGIETVILNVAGNSTIAALDSGMQTLDINGTGNITITALENQDNLATIDAAGASGRVQLSFGGALGDVDYIGSSGVDVVTGNGGDSTFNTGEGNDVVVDGAGGGSNTINTGNGNDTVTSQDGDDVINTGAGTDTINVTGTGDDTTVLAGGDNDLIQFNATNFFGGTGGDTVDGGEGTDTLEINNSVTDASFSQVSSIEVLTLGTGVDTASLGANAQAAGIRTINLSSDTETVTSTMTTATTINAGAGALRGADTVTTGIGDDVFNFGESLTNADNLNGDGGFDTLNLDGDTTLSPGNNAFRNFERVNLLGTGNHDYDLDLSNNNAPSVPSSGARVLTIDGGTLGADDTAEIDTQDVTLFDLNITTGAAADDIELGGTNNVVSTGAGNDDVTGNLGTGATSIVTGSGDDDIIVTTTGVGSVTIDSGSEDDFVRVSGTGSKTIATGSGNDNVAAAGDVVSISLGDNEDTLFVDALALNDNQTADGGNGSTDLVEAAGAVTDALFTNFSNFEVFRQTGAGTSVLGVEAQAAGIRTVIDAAGNDTVNTYDLSAYTADVLVILNDQEVTAGHQGTFDNTGAGGDDTVITGSGNDTVILDNGANPENNNINLGLGNDTIIDRGTAIGVGDVLNGGLGNDTIAFNNGNLNTNIGGPVTTTIDLATVTSFENYVFTDSGDRTVGVDADNNTITFTGTPSSLVGTLTPLNVDFSALTDGDDSATLTLASTLADADFAFTIMGAGAGVDVIVSKENIGINNNINFMGGASNDTLRISGVDLGSTITFAGGTGPGIDTLVQTGGNFDDDGFDNISGIEVLSATPTGSLSATLGQQAEASGFTQIIGGILNDSVTIDAAFDGTFSVNLSQGGSDSFNGGASDAVFNFALGLEADAGDTIVGGSTANDTLTATGENVTNLVAGTPTTAVTNLTGVRGVEAITVTTGTQGSANTSVIVMDTKANEVAGGVQNLTVVGTLTTGGALQDSVVIDVVNKGVPSADAAYNIAVGGVVRATIDLGGGADTITVGANVVTDIRTGGGNDTVDASLGGQADISGGDGNDSLTGGAGADVLAGGNGNDTLTGGAGDDDLFGGNGNDTINDGIGSDDILGGQGADIINLANDNVRDNVYYAEGSGDSFGALPNNRDTINGFEVGVDKIIIDLLGGEVLNFLGNVNSFAEVDSSLPIQAAGTVNAIYDQANNILYVDLNRDGELDAQDLQIIVNTEGDVALTSADLIGLTTPPALIATNAGIAGPDVGTFTNGRYDANELTIGIAANLQP